MWKKQEVFRSLCQRRASQIFETIDDRLLPEVFLIGFRGETHELPENSSVRLETEAALGYWLAEDRTLFLTIGSGGSLARKVVSSPTVNEPWGEASLLKNAFAHSILKSLEADLHYPTDEEIYFTSPVNIGEYQILLGLSVRRRILKIHKRLHVDQVKIHRGYDYPVPTSFAEAVIFEFLRQMHEELSRADPLGGLIHKSHIEEILRQSGRRLMEGCVLRVDQKLPGGAAAFYEDCTAISSLKYEGAFVSGGILLATAHDTLIKPTFRFQSPGGTHDYRKVRKLLELGDDQHFLHCDSEFIYGVAALEEVADDESVFLIKMLGHHHWELQHAGDTLMRVLYGQPYFPQPALTIANLREKLRRVFPDLGIGELELLVDLVEVAEQESHGTILVISNDAAQEAERLSGQGVRVQPTHLTPETLKLLTPIDGAVLISPQAVCFSIGTILDGMAYGRGDASRGSRYNSALRYIASIGGQCVAVVVSEDGGVDVLMREDA